MLRENKEQIFRQRQPEGLPIGGIAYRRIPVCDTGIMC